MRHYKTDTRKRGGDSLPRLGKVAAGVALYARGWAVHGKDRAEAWQRFMEAKERRARIDALIRQDSEQAAESEKASSAGASRP